MDTERNFSRGEQMQGGSFKAPGSRRVPGSLEPGTD